MQTQSVRGSIIINPASMTKDQSIFAGLVLDDCFRHNITNFLPNQFYSVDPALCVDSLPEGVKKLFSEYSQIKFSCRISASENQRSLTGVCYYVFNHQQKSYQNSIFHHVAGVLQPQADGTLQYKDHKNRVAKSWAAYKDDAEREYALTSRNKFISPKPLSVLKNTTPLSMHFKDVGVVDYQQSVMVMGKLSGRDLQYYITQEQRGRHIFSLDQRLQLSRQLLNAYITQVQMNNIVHRDISAHNIRVDLGQPDLSVIIFDYGTSVDKNDKQSHRTIYGTPIYMSPEIYDMKDAGFASDIYSLGWVLAMLWHADEHPVEIMRKRYLNDHKKTYALYQAGMDMNKCLYETAHNCVFRHFFKGIDGLSRKHQKQIACMIQQMVNKEPQSRPLAEDILGCFERIISSRRRRRLPIAVRAPAKHAYQIGANLRNTLQFVASQDSGIEMLTTIVQCIKQSLESIESHPQVVMEWIDAAHLNFLADCLTKEAITAKLDFMSLKWLQLSAAFSEIKQKSNQMLSEMHVIDSVKQKNQIKHIAKRVAVAEKKYFQPRNLDDVLQALPKLEKYVNLFSRDIDQLCSINVTGPSLHKPTCM